MHATTVAIDLAKDVFQLAYTDAERSAIEPLRASSRPAVSTSRAGLPRMSASPSLRSRVRPGRSDTSAVRLPVMRLNNVDLPTFGRPTIAT